VTKPAFIVEGAMERRIIEQLCGGVPVRLIGANGTEVPIEAMAKFAYAQVRMLLNRFFPIVIIFDREGRDETADDIAEKMIGCLACRGIDPGQIRIYVADCCSESWIMPCIDEKCEIIQEVTDIKPPEKPCTKGNLKRRFRANGLSYVETVDGVRLFCSSGAERMAMASENFRAISEFSSTPSHAPLYSPHPFPRGGVLETAWITWGGSGARAGRGRQAFARRETVPIVPGVSSPTPPALRPERPGG
jgi:hypothetical protein